MGDYQVLPTADDTTYFIGAYSGTDLTAFNVGNPSTNDAKWAKFTPAPAYNTKDPSTRGVGSLGDAAYYNSFDQVGPYALTSFKIDSTIIMNQRKVQVNENNSYNSAKSSYDGKKKTYNDAVTAEQDRAKDFFKATFEPKIAIPTRPTQPTQPMAYMG